MTAYGWDVVRDAAVFNIGRVESLASGNNYHKCGKNRRGSSVKEK